MATNVRCANQTTATSFQPDGTVIGMAYTANFRCGLATQAFHKPVLLFGFYDGYAAQPTDQIVYTFNITSPCFAQESKR